MLVCNEANRLNREKLRYAAEKSIPIVSSQWLNDCISQGSMMPMTEYSISGPREGDILRNKFWHPVHSPRPHRQARKGLTRHKAVEVMGRGEGFSKHEDLDKQKRASRTDDRVVQEPLQELQPEMNSPKKQTSSVVRQKKRRPNMPFDDEDDDDDNFHNQDDTINTFNDDEPPPQEVEDSIVQSEMLKPSSPTESSPLPTLPPMPTIPSFDASATTSVPPAQPQEPAADPTPTQNTTRLNNTLAELLHTHKARQHKQSQPAHDVADAPPSIPAEGTADAPPLHHPPLPPATVAGGGGGAAAPRLRTHQHARTLGRAPSNPSSLLTRLSTTTSTSSASAALSRPNSALAAIHPPSLGDGAESEEPGGLATLDDLDAALFRPHKPDPETALFRPSQALSYDNPEAGKAQREMARVFGTGIGGQMDGGGDEDERNWSRDKMRLGREAGVGRVRVEEIGVVRDKLDGGEDGDGIGEGAGRKGGKGSGARNTRSKRREKVGV